jgi:hypothetical protein
MFEVNGKKYTQDPKTGFLYEVEDFFVGQDNKKALQDTFIKEHSETKVTLEKINIHEIMTFSVDTILDLYNDYMTLYNILQDTIYQARAKVIYRLLKNKLQPEGGETI